ncbi:MULTISPECIES: amino acid permease [unclassified Gemella]|uniref:amino acid permease n=1 Tax=unclassified Gemella TaxID=2624949 RepID=UPI001C052F1F|nr:MULTISPECIES: amino acid permease [unclassified Gemella]MBU0278586.1 amino acid permease [Gemella sp. zg-1178]QWQ38288.1 amino acid permease [Gemella sp. zg-570]
MSIFRKKSITNILNENKKKTLTPTLKTIDLILFGLGAIIGSGVMVLTGIASASAGPAIIFSFLIAGIACTIVALCYAEMASALPSSGSTYTYMYVSIGEIGAYGIGWVLMGGYIIIAAAVAAGWSKYFNSLLAGLNINLPEEFLNIPKEGGYGNIPAILLVLLLTFIISRGTSESKIINNFLVFIKIGVVVLFIIVGAFYVQPHNLTDNFAPTGVNGVMLGATTVFFAYLGFDAISTSSEETINPEKTMPRAIIITLLICTIIYMMVCLVLTGAVHYSELGSGNALVYVLNKVGQTKVAGIISLGATIGLMAGVLSFIFASARIGFTMARDGLLPKALTSVNKKHVPSTITWLVGISAAIFTGFLPLDQLSEIANVSSMIGFMLVSYSTIVFRKTHPDTKRGFVMPAVPVLPGIAILIFGFLLLFTVSSLTWLIFFVWLFIGLAVYFIYSNSHSKLK